MSERIIERRPRRQGAKAPRTPTPIQTLKDLYVHELKALYSAEEQILKALHLSADDRPPRN
jgi:hypothetical protein